MAGLRGPQTRLRGGSARSANATRSARARARSMLGASGSAARVPTAFYGPFCGLRCGSTTFDPCTRPTDAEAAVLATLAALGISRRTTSAALTTQPLRTGGRATCGLARRIRIVRTASLIPHAHARPLHDRHYCTCHGTTPVRRRRRVRYCLTVERRTFSSPAKAADHDVELTLHAFRRR